MLTLLLLRHGKAEAAGPGGDFARVLTDKGKRDAGQIGDFLVEHRLHPDIALVSSAARTCRTYELVAERTGPVAALHKEDKLYNASVGRLADRIEQVDAAMKTVLIVGHNPGIMEIAVELAQQGDLAEIDRLRGRFPPCGLAVLSFDAQDWAGACASGGRLDALVFPEDLDRGTLA